MMKKYLRVLLFAALVLTLFTVTVVAASAANPFSTGGNTYATLPEAVAAVSEGGTITMTESAEFSGSIVLNYEKTYTLTAASSSVTLTLTDGSLRIEAGVVTLNTLKIYAKANNAVMVKGADTEVYITNGTYVSEGASLGYAAAVTADGSAYLQIDNGSFSGAVGTFDTSENIGSTGGTSSLSTRIVINNGTFTCGTKTPTAYVLRVNRQYTTMTINGGTFTNDYNNGAATAGHTMYFSTTTGVVTITDGTFISKGRASAHVIMMNNGTLNISGGTFYALNGSSYSLSANNSSKVNITGGFFTFCDELSTPSDIDLDIDVTYANSMGEKNSYGVYINTSGAVRISGGTFMGGSSYQALSVTVNAADVVVSGGDFYGHRAVSVYGQLIVTGGNFYHNPGQPNAKIIDIRNASAKFYAFGGNFNGTHVSVADISTGAVVYFEKAGAAYIYGGSFTLGGTKTDGTVFGMNTAGTLEFMSGSATLSNGVTYTGTGATVTKSGAGSLLRGMTNGATVRVKAGSFTTEDTAAGFYLTQGVNLSVSKGSFTARENSTMFTVNATNAVLSFAQGGTAALETYDSATGFNLSGGEITVAAGTFTANGPCLVNFVIPEGKGSFSVSGGTFILNDSAVTKGGAVIRAGVAVQPQADKGQYYDPTEIYVLASAEIKLLGGTFIDNRQGNSQIIDATLGNSVVTVNGALLLSRYLQTHFVDANNEVDSDVLMNDASATCLYGGLTYYCYFAEEASSTTRSPEILADASVLLSKDYEGIRFTSMIPADIASGLPTKNVAYGTLIAPADYVVAAGGFTHEKLSALAANHPELGTTYVDIPAVYSIVTLPDGSIAFSGALVNLKEANYDRPLAVVAYVKVRSTYHYSSYDAAVNNHTMAAVTKAAYTDYTVLPDEDHMTVSLYNANGFSAFDAEQQQILKNYCGYTHTLDTATVTPSTSITVAGDASANLQEMANALSPLLTSRGYTSTGAAILVGDAGTRETNKALGEIEGDGYYIGVINGKIVIVGTTNALTMQALSVFVTDVLTDVEQDGTLILREIIVSNVEMLPLNSDTPFVFSWHRDGNIWQPYTSGGDRHYDTFNFIYSSTNHLYNKEGNEDFYVDYPVVAAILLGDKLDGSGYNFVYAPDNLATGTGTIHIGITDYALQTALLGRDAGYYGYTVKNGNVVITAFDDSTLRLAKKLFEDDLADFATDNGYVIPYDYEAECSGDGGFAGAFDSYTGATGTGNVAEEVKNLVTDPTLCPRPAGLQLSGVVNVDSDNIEYYYENAGYGDYYNYCRLLESKGFTVYMAQRTAEESYFVTYVNNTTGIMLHVMLHAYAHAAEEQLAEGTNLSKMFKPTLRVIAARTTHTKSYIHQLLDESMLRVPATGKLTQTKVTSMEVSYDLNDKDKRNFGFCYVYTLEDGTFLVLDGGGGGHNSTDATRLHNLLTDLYTDAHGYAPSASKPIEITWLLSHGHGDHYGMMDYYIKNYCNKKNFLSATPVARVDKLIANMPSNDEIYNSMDPNQTVPNLLDSNSWYTNNDGTYVQYYKVHTGQKFFVGNVEFEVMYTHEDIHPWGTIYFNNTSTVLRLTAYETDGNGNILPGEKAISLMNLGDLQVRGSQTIRAMWGDYLKSDMVLSSHHGGNGVEAFTYYRIDAQIILWSHCANSVQTHMSEVNTSAYEVQNTLWMQNTRWLYIFTGQPLDETPANKYQYNPTMTLTKDGIVGLPLDVAVGDAPLTDAELKSYADQFIAGLTNEYPNKAGSSFTWGTGQFHESTSSKPSYTAGTNNNGLILWRGNASYKLPDPKPVPDPSVDDTHEDVWGDGMVEIFG